MNVLKKALIGGVIIGSIFSIKNCDYFKDQYQRFRGSILKGPKINQAENYQNMITLQERVKQFQKENRLKSNKANKDVL